MSSILKALTKLREESPKRSKAIFWPKRIKMRQTAKKRPKPLLYLERIVFLIPIVIFLGGFGWLIYNEQPDSYRESNLETVWKAKEEQSIEMASVATEMTANETVTSIIEKRSTPTQMEELRSKEIKDIPLDEGEAHAKEGVETSNQVETSGSTAVKPVEKQEPIKMTAAPVNKIVKEPETTTGKEMRPSISAEPMRDSRLNLQAIAWSDNPERRIAVINNHVVREGSSFEGFYVILIAKEEVIVREDGKNWKLIFGK